MRTGHDARPCGDLRRNQAGGTGEHGGRRALSSTHQRRTSSQAGAPRRRRRRSRGRGRTGFGTRPGRSRDCGRQPSRLGTVWAATISVRLLAMHDQRRYPQGRGGGSDIDRPDFGVAFGGHAVFPAGPRAPADAVPAGIPVLICGHGRATALSVGSITRMYSTSPPASCRALAAWPRAIR